MSDQAAKPTLFRRALRRVLTLSVTSLVLAAAIGTGVVLYGGLATRAAISDAPDPAPALLVSTAAITMQDSYDIPRRFTGQVEAGQRTDLSFEEGGTVAEINIREGAVVAEGDVLARLDTRLLDAEMTRLTASRATLEAQAELARRTNARQAELLDRGHATEQTVDDTSLRLVQLQASLAEMDAAIAAVAIRLEKAELRAPYAGIVSTRIMDDGAIAAPGAPVLTLLEDQAPRLRVGVDPRLAATLSPGDAVTVEDGDTAYTARLTQIAPDLDPMTRSRTLFFTFDDTAPPARTSADLVLTQTVDMPGAWLPLSALRQGPEGTWQIMTVAQGPSGPVAGLEAVEVIAIDGPAAFVRGTFTDGQRYITEGTHRVVAGEAIRTEDTAPQSDVIQLGAAQ